MFAFYILEMRQVQPTYMSQGARISSFTFNMLMNIVFGPISLLQFQLLHLYKKTTKEFAFFALYMNDIFRAFKTD